MFLADVPYKNKYAYLMIIHTERGLKHGTTSNVSIRLIGEKHSTMEHVINYPDPEKRLLQRGNVDWFILASQHYLGRIMKVELWFDSVGVAPNWKCRDIEIWDLQSLDHWYFPVMQFLSLMHMKDSKLVVELEGTVKSTKRRRFLRLFNRSHFWALNLKSNAVFRLSVVYAVILNIFLFCVVFYGLPSIEETDSLSTNTNFTVNYTTVVFGLASSLIVFVVYCPLVMLFRKAEMSLRKSGKSILYCCWNNVCRIFIVVNIIFSNTMLIVFGAWMSGATSFVVLSAVLIGVAFYAFVLEFIMKFIVKDSSRAHSFNIGQVLSVLLEFVEMQRGFIYSRFGHSGLRPYLGHFYEPLSEEELVSRKERSIAKIKALELLEDLVMYLVYIMLLYLVLLSSRESSFIYNNLQLKSVMATERFSSIYALWEANDFINLEFLEDTQSSTWYPHYTSLDAGLMSDKHNSYFGVARLRQSRGAKFEYCRKPSEKNHSRGWTDDNVNEFDRLYQVWLFFTKKETGAEGYQGKVCYYDGSGYLAPLGRTYKNSHVNFDYLRRNNWIDFSTRFVIIEFLSYNVHTNLFNTVEYVYEFSVTGAIFIQFDCDTARLLTREEEISKLFLPIMAAFLIVLFILSVRLTTGFIKERKLLLKYFHGWLLIDIFIIVLCIVSLILFYMRDILVNNFLSELERKNLNQYVPYMNLFFAEFIFITISAILICISTLRLWKLLRFIKIFKVFERTLALFFLPIINLFICSLCFNITFGMTGLFLFGDYSRSFKDVPTSMMNLALLSIGQNYLFDFADYNNPLHYLYHASFMIISRCINSLYITIIIIHYEQARIDISNTDTYSLIEYVRDGILTLYELIRARHFKHRKRGGQDNPDDTPNVFPKSEEHRYANCKTISTTNMKIMNMIAQTIILGRNVTDAFSKTRFRAITKLIYMLKSKPKPGTEIFFLDKTDPKAYRLIDDHRMLEMQKIANILLDSEKNKPDYENRQMERYKRLLRNYKMRLDYYEEYVEKLSNLIVHIDSAISIQTE